MTTEEIKDKVAKEDGHRDWIGLIKHDSPYNIDRLWGKVNEHFESENTRLRADRDGLLKTLEEMKNQLAFEKNAIRIAMEEWGKCEKLLESEKKDVAFLKGKINEIEKEYRETSHKLLDLQLRNKG